MAVGQKSFFENRGTRQLFLHKCFRVKHFPVPRGCPTWDKMGQTRMIPTVGNLKRVKRIGASVRRLLSRCAYGTLLLLTALCSLLTAQTDYTHWVNTFIG